MKNALPIQFYSQLNTTGLVLSLEVAAAHTQGDASHCLSDYEKTTTTQGSGLNETCHVYCFSKDSLKQNWPFKINIGTFIPLTVLPVIPCALSAQMLTQQKLNNALVLLRE